MKRATLDQVIFRMSDALVNLQDELRKTFHQIGDNHDNDVETPQYTRDKVESLNSQVAALELTLRNVRNVKDDIEWEMERT